MNELRLEDREDVDSAVSCPVLQKADQTRVQTFGGATRLLLLVCWWKREAFCSYTAIWGAAPGVWCLTAQWADGELPLSAVSDLGSQSRVLLANGLVVLQDPLQVGHRLVPILTLNLRRGRIRKERKEIKNKIFIAQERKKNKILHLMTSWVTYS